MEGNGILRQANGVKFKGRFQKGMKEGFGIQEDADGVRSEGEYHMDLRNGEFIEKDKSGTIIKKVTYLNGVPRITSEQD
jgi:antitoxin component YwqK of YwqJK toxin-antitoxin module